MFDSLSGKLQNVFRNLRGLGRLSESNVADALRDVRLALLDADVNFKVARDFIERVKQKAIGQQVIQSIQPGQQVIKIIHDELVELLGAENAGLNLGANPCSILMVGLHGSGKTTLSGKLARWLQKQGRAPLLVAADVYRPAAMDQLATLGQKLDLPVFVQRDEPDVVAIARAALEFGRNHQRNVLIFDTAGRLQIDEPLVQELVRLRDAVQPQEILLVLDAATGQEAVNVAAHFNEALNITGAVLTKLDGDARGGAALSFKAVVGRPIKLMGVGEKLEDLEPFHPERMAQRILGMGDVVSLVEKAAEAVDLDEARKIEEKMRKGQFTLEDFLDQLRQMRKLGPLEDLVGLLPGGGDMLKQADLGRSEKEFRHMEGIICAMTPQERRSPQILNARRRIRIATGSGVKVSEVNQVLQRFGQMQQMMKQMGKFQKMMTRFGGVPPPGLFRALKPNRVGTELAIIVPVYNEQDNVLPLLRQVAAAMSRETRAWELVFVDDGSADATWARIEQARGEDRRVRGLRHALNAGQSAAVWTGLQATSAPLLATLDGDLQNDPAELPRMLAMLNEVDFVCGQRVRRQDTWLRRASSAVARWCRTRSLGYDFRDTGCALRVFKREVLAGIPGFNGVHRFLPILVAGGGFRTREIPVNHRPRVAGASKYGVWNRLGRGIYDLLGVGWYQERRLKPVPLIPGGADDRRPAS